MKFTMPILAIIVALLLVASQSIYTVDQRKYAIKFQLGEIIETQSNAGLYFKVPLVQNVKFYDKVNLTLDNPEPDRMTTSEKKPLLVDFIVLWRILDVKQYYVSVQGDEEAARRRLSQTVRANLAEEFNKRTVHEAISTDRDKITNETRVKANADAATIGVEVIDVRLRRVELPPDVTGPVYQRMESERRRVANELRSLGAAESEKIRADADRQRQVILADAYRAAQKIKGEGDGRASSIYAQAYGQNPEFYAFYRSLEAYKTTFRNKSDMLVLDPSSDFFQYFKQYGSGRATKAACEVARRGGPTDGCALGGVRAGADRRGPAAVHRAAPVARDVPAADGAHRRPAPVHRPHFHRLRPDLAGGAPCVNGCSRKRSRTSCPARRRGSRRCAARCSIISPRGDTASCSRRSSSTSSRC